MKALSKTLKENGIAFSFPIEIKDVNGNETYFEDSDGYWRKREFNANGNNTYFEDSGGYWRKREYDVNGNVTYYERENGYWWKWEYNAKGKITYYETSDGYWWKSEYDDDGTETYYEASDGQKRGTPKSQSCDSVSATLDDKAWKTAEFVQKLCEVQNQYFDRLADKSKEEGWHNGMDVETFKDHLFDYVFNTPCRNGHPELTFSEYISTFNNSGTGVIDKDSQTEPSLRYDKKVIVKSRYNNPRHFYLIDNDWFYDVCGDSAVGMSCVPDGSLGHVDPSGGPFVGVDTNLSDIHKDLPDACVTKIERDTDRGLFKLSVD